MMSRFCPAKSTSAKQRPADLMLCAIMQIREAYRMVVRAKAEFLKEHPELDKDGTAEVPKQVPSERSLNRRLSARSSFK